MSAPVRYLRGPAALLLGVAIAATPVAQVAAQNTSLSLDAQAGINYASNPFIVDGGDAGSFYADLLLQPELQYQDELNNASIVGHYRRSQYFKRYDGVDGYGADLRAQRQLGPSFTVNTSVGYDSSIIGQGGIGVVGVIDPNPVPDLITPDVALLGLRQRQKTLSASFGAAWRVSARDSLVGSVQANRSTYGRNQTLNALTSLTTKSANLGYSRTVSDRISLGVQGMGSWTEFGRRGFSGHSYSPQATLGYQYSEKLRFSLALGAVFISSTANGVTSKATGLSGSISGCRPGERGTLCVSASSDAQATGLGDISRRLGASVNYSYRLSDYDVVNATADYSRVKETSNLPQLDNVGFVGVGGGYERRLSERMSGGLSVNYRQVTGSGLDRPSDMNVRLYVRTRLGDIR